MKTGKDIWDEYWQGDGDRSWWRRPAPEVVEFIALQSPAERPDVLDLGCGFGRHAIAFAQAGFSVTACDRSDSAISQMSDWVRDLSLEIRVVVCDALSEKLPENAFDIVLAYNVIYHGYRHEFASAIDRVWHLLRPGGLFYLTCPSRDDGKYGFGKELAPHTFTCEKSITPGDMHYFSDEADLDELLSRFVEVSREKKEGYWDNEGERQFYSNWHIIVRKEQRGP
ncbi:MAG: class I SAM-dependent methyltransferase [bacterium]|jgi:SAM-dependent methyltransferase